MSEEEKETIEDCKELVQELKQHKDKDFIGRLYYKNKPVEDILSVLLNLIEKQQKELDNLKEIEKSHKEENEKLRIVLEQEKVISEYWQDRFLEQVKYGNKITVSGNPIIIKNVIDAVTYDYIHKDKIKGMMKYREFELQQEYKEFEEDVEWRTYKKILEEK